MGSLFARFKRYPCVLQDDASTCGVACLATVARRYGEHPSWHHLREAAGNLLDGSNMLGLSTAAKALGFMSRAVAAVPEALSNLPTPFVAHVLREGNGHFVVVHEIENNHVVVADPAIGVSNYTRQQFLEAWTGKALLLTRQHELPSALAAPSLFRRLLGLVVPHRMLLAESLAASVLTSAMAYASALLFSNLIDTVFPSGEVWTLHLFAVLAIGLALFTGLFTVVNTLLVVTIGQRVSVHLMFPTLWRLLRLPMAYYDSRRLGDILHRFGNLMSLKSLVTRGPVTVALDGMVLVLTSAGLFLYDWRMALGVIGTLPVMLLVTLLTRWPLRRLHAETLTTGGKLDSQLVSMLGGISTVKTYGAEEMMMERSEPWVGKLLRLGARIENLSLVPRVVNRILGAGAIVLIYWLGGMRVMTGELSLGQLVFCITLAGSIIPPFLSLLEMVLSVQQAMATLDRATDIVDAELEAGAKKGVVPSRAARGELRIEGASFHYGQEEDTIREVSLTAAPGEIVAIVGESGSGKSTLLKLMQRFYVPQAGRILVDGTDVRDWDLAALRSLMAVVDQDCRTFAGSIRDNLQLAGASIPFAELQSATRLVGLAGFVEKLPGRYETEVGESGARLSGGERQRLAIARAIARRPKILLLDEATSHVDPSMERDLFIRLKLALKGTTMILATHRVALAQQADRVLVLKKGMIVEEGTPEDLIKSKGLFARFCGGPR